jgi:hypothetical protein
MIARSPVEGVAQYFALTPVLTGMDVVRSSRLLKRDIHPLSGGHSSYSLGRESFRGCSHRLSECDCLDYSTPKVFVLTHSAYYLTAEDWGKMARGSILFIISHLFEGVSGNLAGEYDWEVVDGMVSMRPRAACGTDYVHPNITEMLRSGSIPCGDDRAYGAEDRVFGDTYVYYFVVSAEGIPVIPRLAVRRPPVVPPVAEPVCFTADPLANVHSVARVAATRLPISGSDATIETATVSIVAAVVRQTDASPELAWQVVNRAIGNMRNVHAQIVGLVKRDRSWREARDAALAIAKGYDMVTACVATAASYFGVRSLAGPRVSNTILPVVVLLLSYVCALRRWRAGAERRRYAAAIEKAD